jgi:hypothetical protein
MACGQAVWCQRPLVSLTCVRVSSDYHTRRLKSFAFVEYLHYDGAKVGSLASPASPGFL